jgi:hypothetical protein
MMIPMFQRTVLAFAILASATTFTVAAESQEARKACADDANTHCPDEVPDREKVYACLVQKLNQLSPPCKKIISDSIAPPQRRR